MISAYDLHLRCILTYPDDGEVFTLTCVELGFEMMGWEAEGMMELLQGSIASVCRRGELPMFIRPASCRQPLEALWTENEEAREVQGLLGSENLRMHVRALGPEIQPAGIG